MECARAEGQRLIPAFPAFPGSYICGQASQHAGRRAQPRKEKPPWLSPSWSWSRRSARRRSTYRRLLGAAPFDLQAAICIQGLLMVALNRWDPATRATLRPLHRGFPRRRHLETKRGAVREEEALSAGGGDRAGRPAANPRDWGETEKRKSQRENRWVAVCGIGSGPLGLPLKAVTTFALFTL
jgi:hypothetical protein